VRSLVSPARVGISAEESFVVEVPFLPVAVEKGIGRRPDDRQGRDGADQEHLRLAQLDGVRGEMIEPEGVDRVPRLNIVWDPGRFPLDGAALRQAVVEGEPRVMLDDNSATGNSIAVDPFQLQPGEAAQVGDAVVAALRASLTNRPRVDAETNTELGNDTAAQLYDLAADPGEAMSVAAKNPSKVKEMADLLRQIKLAGRSRP
jgi:hypothetical protein